MFRNFVKYCLRNNAVVYPLAVDSKFTGYGGICNPSIIHDTDGKLKLVLRNVNYALFKNENEDFINDTYGPLCYMTPDGYNKLVTKNFMMTPGETVKEIDTSGFDIDPKWEFVGLEDARLVRWDDKLYITGVRRDVDDKGTGRMELSQLDEDGFAEISRVRIEAPKGFEDSYCEKNWMPVLDKPYHYVRWCNPLQLVKVNPDTGESEIILEREVPLSTHNLEYNNETIRGSSQVISVGDKYMAIVHRCQLWVNEKGEKTQSRYIENFIVWDREWNVLRISEPFNFADFEIEFTNGLSYLDGVYYIPFALQDNISFMIEVDRDVVDRFIWGGVGYMDDAYVGGPDILVNFFNNTKNSEACAEMGDWYYESKQYAAAMVLYYRAAQYNTMNNLNFRYRNLYMTGMSIAMMGGRDTHEANIWCRMIDLCPHRSEGYIAMSRFCYCRNRFFEAYMYASAGERKNCYKDMGRFSDIDETSGFLDYIKAKYTTERYGECKTELQAYLDKSKEEMTDREIASYLYLMYEIENNEKNKTRIL